MSKQYGYSDVLLASYQATLRARIRAARNNATFHGLGEESMRQAIDATEGAMRVLEQEGMISEEREEKAIGDEGCKHPDDKCSPTTAHGTLPRFYCGKCNGFFETNANGDVYRYQEEPN